MTENRDNLAKKSYLCTQNIEAYATTSNRARP